MPPMPFVHRNIYTVRSMLPHASTIQQNQNSLSRSPPDHNRTHIILLSRGQSAQSTIQHHTNIMEICSNHFLESRHRTRTLQTKRHLGKYISKVHRTRSGQECATSQRPAKIQSTSNPTTRRLPREVQQLHKTHCQIHNSRPDECHTPTTHRTKEIQHN
jgi:hypothetical protein